MKFRFIKFILNMQKRRQHRMWTTSKSRSTCKTFYWNNICWRREEILLGRKGRDNLSCLISLVDLLATCAEVSNNMAGTADQINKVPRLWTQKKILSITVWTCLFSRTEDWIETLVSGSHLVASILTCNLIQYKLQISHLIWRRFNC